MSEMKNASLFVQKIITFSVLQHNGHTFLFSHENVVTESFYGTTGKQKGKRHRSKKR
jgi:hypothetical protein